jgi:hypothetical protein
MLSRVRRGALGGLKLIRAYSTSTIGWRLSESSHAIAGHAPWLGLVASAVVRWCTISMA